VSEVASRARSAKRIRPTALVAPDDAEKFLLEQKGVEDRRQALIDDLVRQRAEAIKAIDEKLAKLGHKSPAGKHNKSHHKAPAPDAAATPKGKAKA
jgi:hypothetical protein